ncbi:MAG: hypothetical protein ACI4XH_08160 [Acutalibacteraceae bacterium]
MKKDTSEMLKELENCSDFKEFLNANQDNIAKTELHENLEALLKKYNIKKSQAVKASELNEIYAYQIFAGSRMPDRSKLLCIAIGMALPLDEVQLLLRRSGYAPLYVKDPFDCIIAFGIHKGYNLIKINGMLYEYGFNTLG